MTGTVPGSGDTAVNKTDLAPALMASHSSQSDVVRKESLGEEWGLWEPRGGPESAGGAGGLQGGDAIHAGNQGCIRIHHGEGKSIPSKRSLIYKGLEVEQPWCPP